MNFKGGRSTYAPLLNDYIGDDNDLDQEKEEFNDREKFPARCNQKWKVLLGLNISLATFSFTCLILAVRSHRPTDLACQRQLSFYSPLFGRLEMPTVDVTVNGSLFNEHDLLVRRAPSPEVDDAWERLTEVRPILISGNEVSKLGKDPETTVKAPVAWGYGSDAHIAQLDGQHALHCLNAVRKYAYREYYFPEHDHGCNGNESSTETSADGKNTTCKSPLPARDEAHLSHCLHLLLQTLTCNPSTDVITHNWMRGQHSPFPDFDIHKQCRDHSTMIDWQEHNRISVDRWIEISYLDFSEREHVIEPEPLASKWLESWGEAR